MKTEVNEVPDAASSLPRALACGEAVLADRAARPIDPSPRGRVVREGGLADADASPPNEELTQCTLY